MLQTSLAITLALLLGVVLLQTSPAQAAKVDYLRHCEPYHAEGNPDSPWGYTACVKIVHDTEADEVYATASVSTTTPGVTVGIRALHLEVVTLGNTIIKMAPGKKPDASWHTTMTDAFDCDERVGAIAYKAIVGTDAYWPNGVYSPNQNTIARDGPVDQVAIPACQ